MKDDGTVTPLDVKAGDTVLFGKYSGQEIKLDGAEYFIMARMRFLASLKTARRSRHATHARTGELPVGIARNSIR